MEVVELSQLLKQGKISSKTVDRVNIAKNYIEKKYQMKKIKEDDKKRDWDFFNKKAKELNLSKEDTEKLRQEIYKKEADFLRQTRRKISIREFESIAIIGKGAFGEVRVCREKLTGDIVAIKKIRKVDMCQKNQIMHVRTEREILITSKSNWIVNLKYSFQDDQFLYLVMDYLPGGDFMSLLMKKDILNEEESRFYIAEMILAVEDIHKMNCIHRDLKPDNILIDKNGHLKLSDFGLSKLADQSMYPISSDLNKGDDDAAQYIKTKNDVREIRKNNKMIAYSTVGTPDYIAPEVFGQKGYGPEVDWWSIGVILFEMMVGYPPFFSDNPSDTCKKIVKWQKYFKIPTEAKLSREAENLIKKLVSINDDRLGLNGVQDIKSHPFFRGLNWDKVLQMKAPFIPDIKNEWDTKYFDVFKEVEPFYPKEEQKKRGRKDICFLNYTYKRDMEEQKFDTILDAVEIMQALKKESEKYENKVLMNADRDIEEEKNKSNKPSIETISLKKLNSTEQEKKEIEKIMKMGVRATSNDKVKQDQIIQEDVKKILGNDRPLLVETRTTSTKNLLTVKQVSEESNTQIFPKNNLNVNIEKEVNLKNAETKVFLLNSNQATSEAISKQSASPRDLKSSNNTIQANKVPVTKGVNVIPLKGLGNVKNFVVSPRGTADKARINSPKQKDDKATNNISPSIRPITTDSNKQSSIPSEKTNYEVKNSQKMFTNLQQNLKHKSPSPIHKK